MGGLEIGVGKGGEEGGGGMAIESGTVDRDKDRIVPVDAANCLPTPPHSESALRYSSFCPCGKIFCCLPLQGGLVCLSGTVVPSL